MRSAIRHRNKVRRRKGLAELHHELRVRVRRAVVSADSKAGFAHFRALRIEREAVLHCGLLHLFLHGSIRSLHILHNLIERLTRLHNLHEAGRQFRIARRGQFKRHERILAEYRLARTDGRCRSILARLHFQLTRRKAREKILAATHETFRPADRRRMRSRLEAELGTFLLLLDSELHEAVLHVQTRIERALSIRFQEAFNLDLGVLRNRNRAPVRKTENDFGLGARAQPVRLEYGSPHDKRRPLDLLCLLPLALAKRGTHLARDRRGEGQRRY